MRIVLCPKCGKWSVLLEDGIALLGVDCDKCGYSQTWLSEDSVDIETRKLDVREDATSDDFDKFMDALNSLVS